MRTILRSRRLIDPGRGWDGPTDLYVEAGRIAGVEPPGDAPSDWLLRDTGEGWLLPGLVDACAHADPGARARHGGFTTVALVAARPVAGLPWLAPATAAGRPADAAARRDEGAIGLSDDPLPISDPDLARRVFVTAADADLPVAVAAWEPRLAPGAVLGEGPCATRLGLAAAPASAEAVAVARDLLLAAEAGARLHFSHLSTAVALRLIEADGGFGVSAAVGLHHLACAARDAAGYDGRARLQPPLREEDERLALVEVARRGWLAVTADDTPVAPELKQVEFDRAEPGAAAIEYALALAVELLGPWAAVRALSELPARAFGLPCGTLRRGGRADLALFDPEPLVRIPETAPTPLAGRPLRGRVAAVWLAGDECAWPPPATAVV